MGAKEQIGTMTPCSYCGTVFRVNRRWQRYCSKLCRLNARAQERRDALAKFRAKKEKST